MPRPRLAPIRRLLRRLRDPDGFGLIELTIALTILAIATVALTGVFVASHLTLRRASQSDAAAALSDQLLERFRAETWDNIALNNSQVAAADANSTDPTYKNDTPVGEYVQGAAPAAGTDSASLTADITEENVPLAADGTPAATACTNSPEPVTCNPSRTAAGPDGKSYRVDTYVTWGCPNPAAQTLGGTMSAPTCTDNSTTTVLPNAAVKVVTIVVRDASTLASVYRSSTTFDRLGGDSMPTATAIPSGSGGTGSTTVPPVTGVPNPPSSVSFVNGVGSGSPCPCITGPPGITPGNEGSLSFDVHFPSTSLATDRFTLTLTDGAGHLVSEQGTATQGAGVVHVTGVSIIGASFVDGTITVSATATNGSGTSSPTVQSPSPILDTTPPGPITISTPTDGTTSEPRTGPFSGTAGTASGDKNIVTLEFCKASSWTCGSSPSQTATASVDSSSSPPGNWSVTLGTQLQNNQAYTMVVVQQDAAGNTGTSSYVSFHT